MSRYRTLLSLGAVVFVVGLASLIATGAVRPAPPAPTATPAPPSLDLTGTWTGQYTGPFDGPFTLTWNQAGSTVKGTITLPSPALDLFITGTVSDHAISFGSVGLVAYTGTVFRNRMSGSYIDRANGKTGFWTATIFP